MREANDNQKIKIVSPSEVDAICDKGAILLDVRTDIEHRGSRLGRTHLQIPLDKLNRDILEQRGVDIQRPLVLLCQSGKRANNAAEKLIAEGAGNLIVVEGGLNACRAAGMHCHQSTNGVISLERQVRIAAGVFVLSGSLLAALVNSWFLVIPVFVGSGLISAGITDWCGMGLLLAKAPWNQIKKESL